MVCTLPRNPPDRYLTVSYGVHSGTHCITEYTPLTPSHRIPSHHSSNHKARQDKAGTEGTERHLPLSFPSRTSCSHYIYIYIKTTSASSLSLSLSHFVKFLLSTLLQSRHSSANLNLELLHIWLTDVTRDLVPFVPLPLPLPYLKDLLPTFTSFSPHFARDLGKRPHQPSACWSSITSTRLDSIPILIGHCVST